jgi:hypothetical protein
MTQPDGSEKTFTQADLDRVVADRLARERAKYADYDELKTAAQAAKGAESTLDKMQKQLDAMEKRATAAEAESMRSSVAAELGLTPKQARRLAGATREELLADGRELIDDLGIEVKPGTKQDGKKDGEGTETDTDDDTEDDDKSSTSTAPARTTARPTESLKSGARMSAPAVEETDPLKLAALVKRR